MMVRLIKMPKIDMETAVSTFRVKGDISRASLAAWPLEPGIAPTIHRVVAYGLHSKMLIRISRWEQRVGKERRNKKRRDVSWQPTPQVGPEERHRHHIIDMYQVVHGQISSSFGKVVPNPMK